MNHPICIIDDDEDIRGVIEYALEFENIKTISFESAELAEEHLSQLLPHDFPSLIIVDFMMPTMNGVEFISLLHDKYSETLAKIPLALSTGFLSDHIKIPKEVIKLDKPIDLQDLLELVKKYYPDPDYILDKNNRTL
jgi:DNA-binding NtrC family response regulator